MRIGLSYITQIRGSEAEGVDPTEPDPTRRLGGWVAQTVTSLVAAMTAGYHTEHNDDDTHSIIHASGAIYERDRTTAIGDWTDLPFTAANFTAAGAMTWTPTQAQQLVCAYIRLGSTLYLNLWLDSTPIGGTASTSLRVALPSGLAAAQYASAAMHYLNGTAGAGIIKATPGDRFVSLWKSDESNWTLASTVTVHGQMALKVSDGSGDSTILGDAPVLTYAGASSGTINFAAVSNLTFTTAGTYTMTVNRAMTLTFKGVAGGGGGGGMSDARTPSGSGGGGGETTSGVTISLVPSKTYTLIVGAAGAGQATGSHNTSTGGTTSFVNTTDTVTHVSLTGGGIGGGFGDLAGGTGGTGGTGTNRITGGTGGAGSAAGLGGGGNTPGSVTGAGGGGAGTASINAGANGGGTNAGTGGAAGVAGGNNGGLAGAGGQANGAGGGGGGGGGGATFTEIAASSFGGGGGGSGGSSTGPLNGGAGQAGCGLFVFVSAP